MLMLVLLCVCVSSFKKISIDLSVFILPVFINLLRHVVSWIIYFFNLVCFSDLLCPLNLIS